MTSTPENILQETVDLLKGLVAIPSVSRDEDKAANFLHQKLQGWFPNCVKRSGHNLIVDIQGAQKGPTLLLCSHIDTVVVAAGWTRDPFGAQMEGDKLYGLGANDAGASVVSMIAAARMHYPLKSGRLLLCFAAEEEAGNQGFAKVESELPRYDAAIFGEPTRMGMATAMRGSMRATLRSRGKSCHASRPWEGVNAMDKLVKDIAGLRAIDLKDDSPWKQATIEPTIIRGGESSNQIPDLIETTLDIRTTPDKNNDWIIAQLKNAVVEFEVTANNRRPMHNDPSSPLVQAVRRADPSVVDYTFNGSCDMAFSKAPSIVMGPGSSERSHAADEYIAVPELEWAIRTYASVVNKYLSD